MEHGPKEYTKAGNRRAPSYSDVVEWVSGSLASIPGDVIRRAFEATGYGVGGAEVPRDRLHLPLRSLLAMADAHDGLEADAAALGDLELVPADEEAERSASPTFPQSSQSEPQPTFGTDEEMSD